MLKDYDNAKVWIKKQKLIVNNDIQLLKTYK